MGLPALLLVVADNQAPIAASLDEAGVAINMGGAQHVSVDSLTGAIHRLVYDQDRRQSMSLRGRELVDGLGSQRVVAVMVDQAEPSLKGQPV